MIKISARLFINVPCARYIWYDFYSDSSEHICARNFIPIVFRERALVVISWWSGQITKHIFCFCLFPDFHQHNMGSMYFHLKLRLGLILNVALFDVALEIPVSKPVCKKCPLIWMYYHGVISGVDGSRGG